LWQSEDVLLLQCQDSSTAQQQHWASVAVHMEYLSVCDAFHQPRRLVAAHTTCAFMHAKWVVDSYVSPWLLPGSCSQRFSVALFLSIALGTVIVQCSRAIRPGASVCGFPGLSCVMCPGVHMHSNMSCHAAFVSQHVKAGPLLDR
jgi:hypothetical protein